MNILMTDMAEKKEIMKTANNTEIIENSKKNKKTRD